MQLFGRSWRWTVDTLSSTTVDVEWEIERSLSTSTPGSCELKIYNLTAAHRDQIRATRGRAVRLEAGYGSSAPPIIFQGDVRRVDVLRSGGDWIAKVTAGDGEHALRTARVAFALAPGQPIQSAISSITNALSAAGLNTGNARDAFASSTLRWPEGGIFHGTALSQLAALARAAGLSWTVADGTLQLFPLGSTLGRQAILLRAATATEPGTGLIDSPEVGHHGVVTAKSLLIPDLVPAQRVRLESQVVRGTYRVERTKCVGDTRSNDWYVTSTLREATS